jgi:sugar phosphate isomerase/epimerase
MKNLIAARIGCYGAFEDRAWAHLPKIGVHHIELDVPKPDQVEALKRKLSDHGLATATLTGSCPLGRADVAEALRPEFEACQALDTPMMFVSAQAGDLDRNIAYERLRQVGDEAAKHQVTVVMESHPDLITNGDVGLQTMQGVDHDHIRINFDTANFYYHNDNPNITAPAELTKIIDYVASLHLKDTDGGYHSAYFPALGQGVVDFAEVFKMMNARGFTGPFTIELEGMRGVTFDEPGRLKYVADSVEYLRSLGAID